MTWAPVRVAALGVGFVLAGLIGLVAIFDGADTYRDIARASGVSGAQFRIPPNLVWEVDLNRLVDLHQRTLAYVLGDAPQLPNFATTQVPLFDDNERAHMADVRVVFQGTKVAFVVGVVLILGVVRWTAPSHRVRAVRDASVVAGATLAVVAIAAVIAFDPLFLLFHEVFFPQGNFLFGPDSNLIRLYPDAYWYGVTLRIGVAFVAATAIVAIGATATLRRARR